MSGPPPAPRWPRGPAATARTAPGPARRAGRAQSGAEPWRRWQQKTQSAATAFGSLTLSSHPPIASKPGTPCREGAGQGWAPAGPGRGGDLAWILETSGFPSEQTDWARPPLHPSSRAETKHRGWHTAGAKSMDTKWANSRMAGSPVQRPVRPTQDPFPSAPNISRTYCRVPTPHKKVDT